jgi:uncharacterized protein YndB with AHSA1/START domain
MSTYDWSRFSQKIRIKVPVQKVYDAWTTQQGIESWFLRMSEFTTADGRPRTPGESIAAGDTYRWLWHGYPDTVQETGTILEANGNNKLRFAFGEAGNVTVNLTEQDGHTIMEIVQEDIPTDEANKANYHVGCQTGWTFYRANMKAVLEHGIDVRNIGYNNENLD